MRAMIACAALAALLAGCQTSSYQGDETSPYYAVPAGSRLALHNEISFGPDQVGVYIQNGRVLPLKQVQRYHPFCKFELYHRRDHARTVAPDRMTITKVLQQYMQDPYTQARGVLHARLSFSGIAGMGDSSKGGPVIQSFVTRMDLRSEKQPDVYRLTCAHWTYAGTDRPLTIAEIRRTLDPLFTLYLTGQG